MLRKNAENGKTVGFFVPSVALGLMDVIAASSNSYRIIVNHRNKDRVGSKPNFQKR